MLIFNLVNVFQKFDEAIVCNFLKPFCTKWLRYHWRRNDLNQTWISVSFESDLEATENKSKQKHLIDEAKILLFA